MRALRILPLLATALLAACATTSGSVAPGATPASPSAEAAAPSPSPQPALVTTASAMINGVPKTILVDSHGMTLYYNSNDKATTSTCTGNCATNWPPVLAVPGRANGSPDILPEITVLNDANGMQLQYGRRALYRFASDTQPGDIKGEGVGGIWFAFQIR